MQKLKWIIGTIIFGLLILLLIVNIYVLITNVVYGKKMVKVFGYTQTIVLTGSMEPAIKAGDLLVIKEKKEYKTGDIITYKWGDSYVTHRIMEINGEEIIAKGDSNNKEDDPIPVSYVEGKVVLRVKGVGKFILFLKTPIGILSVALLGFLIIEIPYIFKKFKLKR